MGRNRNGRTENRTSQMGCLQAHAIRISIRRRLLRRYRQVAHPEADGILPGLSLALDFDSLVEFHLIFLTRLFLALRWLGLIGEMEAFRHDSDLPLLRRSITE